MKSNLKNLFLGLIGGILGAYGFYIFSDSDTARLAQNYISYQEQLPARQVNYQNPPINGSKISSGTDFVVASAISSPSVVYIQSTEAAKQNYDLFDTFFNGYQGKKVSSGSGVIYSREGYIITNNHVIEGSESMEVIHQRRTYKAKLIGTDPNTDLAVLKIEGKNLPPIRLADSRLLRVGEWVLAVGNPFNLNSTVTAGIVSAKGRNLNIVNSQFPIESFIQTDAAINPGNSGGALVNLKGELVGINTAIYSQTGSYSGYGFAVPSDIVGKVVDDLIKYGIVQKAFTGLRVDDLESKLADQLGIDNLSGVLIQEVQQGSPASKAGLKPNDVIFKVNQEPINSKAEFDEITSAYNPGSKIMISYRRGKQTETSEMTLTNREGTTGLLKNKVFSSKQLDADLEPLSKVEQEKYGVSGGVKIIRVGKGLIGRMGLPTNFVIVSINREPVIKPEQVVELLKNLQGRVLVEGIDPQGQKGYYSYSF